MTPIQWRRAVPKDAPALSVLGSATFLTSFAVDHPGPGLIDHIRGSHSEAWYDARLADPATAIILGETPLGAPVGYAVLCPQALIADPVPGDIELKRIYLLHGWQGNGNGDALMTLVLDAARERHAERMLLAVYLQNARALRFYIRHRFAQIGETTFMVGDTAFRDLIFARPL